VKIHLSDITELGTDLHFDEKEAWVREAIARVDEVPPGKTHPPVSIDLNLRMVDEVLMIQGDVNAKVHLLCSRCSVPFYLDVSNGISTLFCQNKEMAGIAFLTKDGNPRGRNVGHARHAHDWNLKADGDLDITYLAGDTIDLGDVLTEQLQLQVPFQPLCKEDCKGICSNCGTDLNHGRCACSKIKPNNPFAALQKLNLKP